MPEVSTAVRIPLPPANEILKVAIRGAVDLILKEVWENVFHLKYTGGAPSSTDLATLAGYVASQWSTHMAPECPSPTTLKEVDITDLTSPTSGAAAWTGSTAGTRGDDSIPSNAAVLISYPIPRRFQGGHYRTYLYVGGNADLQGAAEWATLFQAEALTHWHDFLAAILGHSAGAASITDLVGVSYVNKATGTPPHYLRSTPLVDTLNIATMYSQLGIASQRRRIGRGGDTEKAPRGNPAGMNFANAQATLARS